MSVLGGRNAKRDAEMSGKEVIVLKPAKPRYLCHTARGVQQEVAGVSHSDRVQMLHRRNAVVLLH